MNPESRFWSKVNIGNLNECWDWLAGCTRKGYGRFSIGLKKISAHRFSYELFNGPIEDGKLICHHCDNPKCCNPRHLFEGTAKDNTQDSIAKGRFYTGEHIIAQKGERNYNAHLTESQIIEIRRLRTIGLTQQQLADINGVDRSTIGYIVRNQRWAHI